MCVCVDAPLECFVWLHHEQVQAAAAEEIKEQQEAAPAGGGVDSLLASLRNFSVTDVQAGQVTSARPIHAMIDHHSHYL